MGSTASIDSGTWLRSMQRLTCCIKNVRKQLRWRVRSLTRKIIHSRGYHNYAQGVRPRKPRVIWILGAKLCMFQSLVTSMQQADDNSELSAHQWSVRQREPEKEPEREHKFRLHVVLIQAHILWRNYCSWARQMFAYNFIFYVSYSEKAAVGLHNHAACSPQHYLRS